MKNSKAGGLKQPGIKPLKDRCCVNGCAISARTDKGSVEHGTESKTHIQFYDQGILQGYGKVMVLSINGAGST